jgi:hypothetical protein
MPDGSLHQPHAKLFRATFSNPENAAPFLRHHLDAPLPTLVDWNSLSLLAGSFIDSKMAGSEADLLFSANIRGSNALLYLLWEHQHSEAPLMAAAPAFLHGSHLEKAGQGKRPLCQAYPHPPAGTRPGQGPLENLHALPRPVRLPPAPTGSSLKPNCGICWYPLKETFQDFLQRILQGSERSTSALHIPAPSYPPFRAVLTGMLLGHIQRPEAGGVPEKRSPQSTSVGASRRRPILVPPQTRS